MVYTVEINSVAVDKILRLNIKFTLTNRGGAFNCSFRDASQSFDIANGYELVVKDGATVRFGGYISQWARDKGVVHCSGLDYTELFAKINVNELYTSTSIDSIISDLQSKYFSGITLNNVYSSGVSTPGEVRFRNIKLMKCMQQLAKYDNCNFFIDQDKDLHFGVLGTNASGVTLEMGSNIYEDSYETNDDNLVNKVKVTGGREDYSKTETKTGDGSTTEFSLTYKPIQARVTVDGTEKTGYKEGMTGSYDYSIDKENKKIVFQTAPGNTLAIVIEYVYTTPIIITSEDNISTSAYGVYEEVIYDETINQKADARNIASNILSEKAYPGITGKVKAALNFTPQVGDTVAVVNSAKGIDGTYIIRELEHNLFGGGSYTIYNINELTKDIVDILSKMTTRIDALEESQRGETDIISYFRQLVDSFSLSDDPANNLTVKTRTSITANTWFFAKPHLFSEPIKFGGGFGQWSANQVANPSE